MARTGLRAACGIVGLLLVVAPRAAAARPAPLTAWLDGDAPVVVSLRPSLLVTLGEALSGGADADGEQLAHDLEVARDDARAAFGVDLFARDGWLSAGFDPDSPVVASIAAIDAPRTASIFDQLYDLHDWSDAKLRRVSKVFWRSRLVVALTDPQRATRTVRALAEHSALLHAVEPSNAAALAMALGGSVRKSKGIDQRLRQRQILAIGWLPGVDAVIALRVLPKRKLLLVDVVGTFAGVPAVWSRDSKKLLAAIERNAGTSKLPAALARGVGADALAADFALWVQPEALLAFTKAFARHDSLRSLALTKPGKLHRRELHGRATKAVESCELLRPLAARGPLLDAALTVDVDATGARARLAWGLRKDTALARALAVRDDGLMAWPGPSDAVLSAAHYLRSVRALRELPRPKLLRADFDELDQVLGSCGGSASAVVALFGWHALLGLALDELRAESPLLAAAVDGASNAALAVRALRGPFDSVGAVSVAFDDEAAATVSAAFDGARGAAEQTRSAGRPVTRWPGSEPRPFRFATPSAVTAFGMDAGRGALAWFLATVGPSATPPIARWTIRVPTLLELTPALPPWLRALAVRATHLDGSVTLADQTLAVELTPRAH